MKIAARPTRDLAVCRQPDVAAMPYACVLASSGHWRVIRREGVIAFTVQSLGREWTDEATVPASALIATLHKRSLGIPAQDVTNIMRELGPPLAFSPGTRPAWDLSFDTHTGGAA